MERNSFIFYASWREQIEDLDDDELRRFIYNLCDFHKGKEVQLITKADRLVWKGILPALNANETKYHERAEKNRENGKLGGRPKKNELSETKENPEKPNGFLQNPENPINDYWILDTENGEVNKEERKQLKEERELDIVSGDTSTDTSNFLDAEEEELIPGTDISKNDLDFDFLDSIVHSSLRGYPNWEEEIITLPIDDFIKKAIEFNPNAVTRTNFVRAFKYWISKK